MCVRRSRAPGIIDALGEMWRSPPIIVVAANALVAALRVRIGEMAAKENPATPEMKTFKVSALIV